MKKFISLSLLLIAAAGFTTAQTTYGEKPDESKAITMDELAKKMNGKTEMEAVVTGKVAVVCQAEGCWMKIAKSDGTSMMVRMKDHKFFLPKDIGGKMAVFAGTVKIKTTSVDMLKHYAEDEGKSKEYIDAIKDPKTEMEFETTGVTIK